MILIGWQGRGGVWGVAVVLVLALPVSAGLRAGDIRIYRDLKARSDQSERKTRILLVSG